MHTQNIMAVILPGILPAQVLKSCSSFVVQSHPSFINPNSFPARLYSAYITVMSPEAPGGKVSFPCALCFITGKDLSLLRRLRHFCKQ